jgi:hypothetical protein
MTIPLDTGDRVAWTERDRGIVVAADPARTERGRRLTVAVWRGERFSGHVARIPAGLLYRTSRLRLPAPRQGSGAPPSGPSDVRA